MKNIKIAIIGPQGSGKTTLLSKLQKEFKSRGKTVEMVNEVARSSPWGINEQATFPGQRWIFNAQMIKELEAEYKNPDIILYDRSVIDNLAYTEHLHNRDEPFPITEFLQMVEIARYWSRRYDFIIYMPFNPSRLNDDGVRSTNVAFAKDIDERIRKMVIEFGLKTLKYRKNFNVSNFCDRFAPQQKKLNAIKYNRIP
jgi:nicotinamide riboside kinase